MHCFSAPGWIGLQSIPMSMSVFLSVLSRNYEKQKAELQFVVHVVCGRASVCCFNFQFCLQQLEEHHIHRAVLQCSVEICMAASVKMARLLSTNYIE